MPSAKAFDCFLLKQRPMRSRHSDLMEEIADMERTRADARNLAKVSVMVARHIMVAAHRASQKVDELELLYDDADFL